MKTLSRTTIALTLSCMMTTAYGADFGFKKLTSVLSEVAGLTSSPDSGNPDLSEQGLSLLIIQQEVIVAHYVLALVELGNAQVNMLEALGESNEAELLRLQIQTLSQADLPDKQRLNEAVTLSNRSNVTISAALASERVLSREGRLLFTTAFIHYALGAHETVQAVEEMKPFARSVRETLSSVDDSASSSDLTSAFGSVYQAGSAAGKLAVTLYLLEATPELFKGHHGTISQLLAYADSNELEIPTDSQSILQTLTSVIDIPDMMGTQSGGLFKIKLPGF